MISTSSLAQNYYDPGFYQNNNYGYANYNTGNYGYVSNNAYYAQQAPQPDIYQAPAKNNNIPYQNTKNTKRRRGVGTFSVGADYVLGYTKYLENEFVAGNFYRYNTKDFDRKSDALSLNIGWRPLKYLGFEAYYLMSADSEKSEIVNGISASRVRTIDQSTSYTSYGFDIIGYYPINDVIELLASIGVGKYDIEGNYVYTAISPSVTDGTIGYVSGQTSKTFKDSVTAYRIGGGFQLWLSRHLAFRLTGRFTSLGGDLADYITEINMGVRYHF